MKTWRFFVKPLAVYTSIPVIIINVIFNNPTLSLFLLGFQLSLLIMQIIALFIRLKYHE